MGDRKVWGLSIDVFTLCAMLIPWLLLTIDPIPLQHVRQRTVGNRTGRLQS